MFTIRRNRCSPSPGIRMVRSLFEKYEHRDAQSIIPAELPEPFPYESQRDYVREVLRNEIHLRSKGTAFIDWSEESEASKIYRQRLHADGVPSEMVALDYMWQPGGELNRLAISAQVSQLKH